MTLAERDERMREEGREERGKEVAIELYDDHMEIEKISGYVKESVETITKWMIEAGRITDTSK